MDLWGHLPNDRLEIDELPDAEDLWWAFALQVARGAARRDQRWGFDSRASALTFTDGPHRLRMQRLYGARTVLLGSTDQTPPMSWSGLPGWATSDAVAAWLAAEGSSLLAWHARGEWDTATPDADVAAVLSPLLADLPDRDSVEAARNGHISDDQLGADVHAARTVLDGARSTATPLQGQVQRFLLGEIHAQMRRARERPRLLPQRPAPLVQWARVADPGDGFGLRVVAERGILTTDAGGALLSPGFRSSLLTVLTELWHDESDEHSGSWLFARVRVLNRRVEYDRAYDSWPPWFTAQPGPSLDSLDWEMRQRNSEWQPSWASLLPDQGR